MEKIDLELKTISEIGNFNKTKWQIFAIYKEHAYFINSKKLDIILSLMQFLSDFNEYINTFNTTNITSWLKSKNLLSQEILDEISYYSIKGTFGNDCLYINQFSDDNEYIFKNYIFKNCMIKLFKTNLQNAIVFNYMLEYNDKFNKFISDIFKHFQSNPDEIYKQNLLDFADYIFTSQKRILFKEFQMIDNLNIICSFDDEFSKFIEIKRKNINEQKLYYESIKNNFIMNFNIVYDKDNEFCQNPQKYLQLAEFLNNKRLIEDNVYYSKLENASKKYYNLNDITVLDNSNFSFINFHQLLILGLDDENKELAFNLLKRNDEQNIYNKLNLFNLNYYDYINFQRFSNYTYTEIKD